MTTVSCTASADATTYGTNRYNAGVTATKVGTAAAAQVLKGYTFTNASTVGDTGTMPNQGAWTGATSGSGNVTIPAGYHNGSGYISGAGAYNKGVTDADARANANSANYKAGYTAGAASVPNFAGKFCTQYGCDDGGVTVEFNPWAGAAIFAKNVGLVGAGNDTVKISIERKKEHVVGVNTNVTREMIIEWATEDGVLESALSTHFRGAAWYRIEWTC